MYKKKEGEADYKYFDRVKDFISQLLRTKAQLKIIQVIEDLKQFISQPLLFSPRRQLSTDNDDDKLSISETDLEILDEHRPSNSSQDLLSPSFESKESGSSSRHENKKVLDIKAFLDVLMNFLENLSDEAKETDTTSLKDAIDSLKKGITETKNIVFRNKSTHRATSARLQSSTSENTLNDHSSKIEELSAEFNKIERLFSEISLKTENKKIKDNSLREKVEGLLLEIKSTTSDFQNLQQELDRQIKQEEQDKERSDEVKPLEDDKLKEKLIDILSKLDKRDELDLTPRNLGQEFSEVSGDLDDDSGSLTEDRSSMGYEHDICFSSRKIDPDSLKEKNLQDLLSTLDSRLVEKLSYFRLQARLSEDNESEKILSYEQEIENKKSEIAHLEEQIKENLTQSETVSAEVATEKERALVAQAAAERELAVAKRELVEARAAAAAAERELAEARAAAAEAERELAAARAEVATEKERALAAQAAAERELAVAKRELAEARAAAAEAATEKERALAAQADVERELAVAKRELVEARAAAAEAERELAAARAEVATEKERALAAQAAAERELAAARAAAADAEAKVEAAEARAAEAESLRTEAEGEKERALAAQAAAERELAAARAAAADAEAKVEAAEARAAEAESLRTEAEGEKERALAAQAAAERELAEARAAAAEVAAAAAAPSSAPAPAAAGPASRPKILRRPDISSAAGLVGSVEMPKKLKDSPGGSTTTRQLKPASPPIAVVPISSTPIDQQEVVRNFLYNVAVSNQEIAKDYYNGTINGSSIKTIIDNFFTTKGIELKDASQAYSLIKGVIDINPYLRTSFKQKQINIPENFFELLLKGNQKGAAR